MGLPSIVSGLVDFPALHCSKRRQSRGDHDTTCQLQALGRTAVKVAHFYEESRYRPASACESLEFPSEYKPTRARGGVFRRARLRALTLLLLEDRDARNTPPRALMPPALTDHQLGSAVQPKNAVCLSGRQKGSDVTKNRSRISNCGLHRRPLGSSAASLPLG